MVFTTSYNLDGGVVASPFVAQHCEGLINKGYNVAVLSPHLAGQKYKININGVAITRFQYFFPSKLQKVAYGSGIPTNLRNSYLAILQFPFFVFCFLMNGFFKSKKHRIIYAHWSVSAFVAILIKLINRNIKVIFMNHGAEIFVLSKYFWGRKLMKFILKHSNYIISNSSYTYSKTQEIRETKNHCVIPPGVDTEKFYPIDSSVKAKHNISPDTFVLFSLGNFIERKGFEYLIKAVDILVNQKGILNIVAVIGGKGILYPKYQTIIEKLNLGKYIILAGFIKQNDLLYYYNSCDVFVHPAIVDSNNDTEGLGVVLSEANACGKPVIASRVGGIVDVIVDRHNGLLVSEKNEYELADAILELKCNSELRNYLAANARQHVLDKFTWEINMEKSINIIDKVLYE